MENMEINHLAVFACAAFNLLLGAVWYSPALFYKSWKTEARVCDQDIESASMAKMWTLSFVLALLMSYNMAFFLADSEGGLIWGLTAGFLTGFGWAAAIFAAIAIFEFKSWKYILINSGYIIVYFTIIGGILNSWT